MRTTAGSAGKPLGLAISVYSAPGDRPTSTLKRWIVRATSTSSKGIVAKVVASCARARDIHRRAPAAFQQGTRQFKGSLLIVGVASRHIQPILRAARLHIGARDLRGHRDEHSRLLRLEGLIIGGQRLDRAAHATEKIQLPEGVEPGIVKRLRAVESAVRHPAGHDGGCDSAAGRRLADLFAANAASGGDDWKQLKALLVQQGARGAEIRARDP